MAFLLVLFVVGLLAGLGVMRADGLASRRLLLAFLLPCGLLCGLMIASVVGAWQAGRSGLGLLLVAMLVAYTAAGNSWVANQLARQVEGRYLATDPLEAGTFDAVILLGGSTAIAPSGRAAVSLSGDRVVLAARMYHAGKAKMIVCTGTTAGPDGAADGELEASREVLQSLGVPADKILQVPSRSTEEDIAGAAELLKEKQWKSVGLITSAWHMRRAIQLAESAELNLTPLPADFLSHDSPFQWRDIVPSPTALTITQRMIKEMLASEVSK
ncbi:MAG: YdcF family protein [Planctomycetales bacterium]|nr:YdcF family protein [Planctomycetales bacterium]